MAPPNKRRRVEETAEDLLKSEAPLADLDAELRLPDSRAQKNDHDTYGHIAPTPMAATPWQGFCEIENEPVRSPWRQI